MWGEGIAATFLSVFISYMCSVSFSLLSDALFVLSYCLLRSHPHVVRAKAHLGRTLGLFRWRESSVSGCFYSAVMFRIKSHCSGGLTHRWGYDCDLVFILGNRWRYFSHFLSHLLSKAWMTSCLFLFSFFKLILNALSLAGLRFLREALWFCLQYWRMVQLFSLNKTLNCERWP